MIKFISFEEVQKLIPKTSRVTIWRWSKKGIFPKSILIGERKVAWIESEVHEWLQKKSNGGITHE